MNEKKVIVISAVNVVVGGTLTILRDCLSFLSQHYTEYRIVALVNNKTVAFFPNIEYIELPAAKKNWINRLWCEYVTMKKISKQFSSVYLWFSLHDTTPNVIAERRAVYCHNSFPFYKWKWSDFYFDYKIVFFSLFSNFAYKKNIKKNEYVIVQQSWLREKFTKQFKLKKENIIVAQPNSTSIDWLRNESQTAKENTNYSFFFPSSSNSHKNFEVLCEAAKLLEAKRVYNFQIFITLDGKENRYSKWLFSRYSYLKSIVFIGFLNKDDLKKRYNSTNCLIFPSKTESWGLPISEFKILNKPMLLADMPYAKTASAGAKYVSYFEPDNADQLAEKILNLINGDMSFLNEQPDAELESPIARSWSELFSILTGSKAKQNKISQK